MPNRWVEHVRAFAAKNKMSYMCAMSDPDIKKGYIPTEKKKQKTEKLEQAMPSTEPTPKNIVIKPRPEPEPEKAKALYDKYLSLRKEKYSKELVKKLEILEGKIIKITQPMLKKELKKDYFTGEDGRKIRFKLIPKKTTKLFPDDGRTMAQGKDTKNPFPYLLFTDEDGKEIESLTEDGKFNQNDTNPNDIYKILYNAIKGKYKYRLINRTAGEISVTAGLSIDDLKSLLPNLKNPTA